METDFDNKLIDQFEDDVKTGKSPEIESFLALWPDDSNQRILFELISIEVFHCLKKGRQVNNSDYSKFGEEAESHAKRVRAQFSIAKGINNRDCDTREDHQSTEGSSNGDSILPTSQSIGPYTLIEPLGEGGMGTVWLAEQEKPVKRRVALKLIKSELPSKEILARFDAEKQALAMMDHPNIARVIDAGTTDEGRPYFVMEWVKGIPITKYCDQNRLSVDERLLLFVSVCKAVQHAHQKGILHRDLKPSNVLVAEIDGEPVPKVIDFGMAKAVQPNLKLTDQTMYTEFGRIVGTLKYMSPEQAEMSSVDIDTRTDVYSLGVVLYKLLSGSAPLDKETLGNQTFLKTLQIIREKDPPKPSSRLGASSDEATMNVGDERKISTANLQKILKGDLDWVVMKALEKDRTRRYQTVDDFSQDISNYLNGDPVRARPPSTWYQVRKFANRHRGLVAAMLAIGVVLLTGIAGTSFGLIRAKQKTKLAEKKSGEAEKERGKAVDSEKRATSESQRARDSEAAINFQLANARWETNRAGDARNLLQEMSIEYRDNFEWNFCNRHFQGSDITCYGHLNRANWVEFSPDGTRFASASTDRTIRIWDARTGEEVSKLAGHTAAVVSVAFSPDGLKLASGSDDSLIKIWDTRSGQELESLKVHEGSVRSVAFSPDGKVLASGSDDHNIRLWELQSGRIGWLRGHRGELVHIAFSPDGGRLVSTARDNMVKLWDVSDLASVEEIRSFEPGGLTPGVAFSPDGSRIATGSLDTITIWDADSGREINTFEAHVSWINCVRFSPDGARLASCGDDKLIRLWDSQSGQELATFTGHSQRGMSIAFSPDGARLASASHDFTVKLWDARSFQPATTLRGHSREIVGMAFDPQSQRLASAGFDHTIRLWDTLTGQEVMKLEGHRYAVRSVVFSPDGSLLASGSGDKTIRLWDSLSGLEKRVLDAHSGDVLHVAFSPDGRRLASGSTDRTIKLWDIDSGRVLHTLIGHTREIRSVAFSPDGSQIASGSSDRTIKLWDTNSGREIRNLAGHGHIITCVAFSPDGLLLASASADHSIKLWDAHSGREKTPLNGHVTGVGWLAFSPNGKRLASTGSDQTLKLWDLQTGKELATIENSGVDLRSVAFAPDGQQIAVAYDARNIRLLAARPDQEVFALTGHMTNVRRVTFSHDGKRIHSEAANEKFVWDVATRKQVENAEWEIRDERKQVSPDGRWFVTSEMNHVLLVDREYRDTQHEKAYRAAKARFDPNWHQEQANTATMAKNWYSATFHFAMLMKNDPDQASFYDGLQSSLEELKSQFDQKELDLVSHLATVVKKSLLLPRGNKSYKLARGEELPNPNFEQPEIQKGTFEFRKSMPGWKTTGQEFEIWSTGFNAVEAHDGNQFVELNAKDDSTLYKDSPGIKQGAVLEFSFAHRGRNGDDTLKLTITDLGADNSVGGGDDQELFTKEYTTGKDAWTVYDSTTERKIVALGNKVRFAYNAVYATGGRGPDNTEGNFLDSAEFGVGVVTAKRKAYGVRRLQAFLDGSSESHYLGMRNNQVGIPDATKANQKSTFVLKVEEKDKFAVLTTSEGKYLTVRGEAVVLTESLEPGSRWLIRNPLKADLDLNKGWFSLESASDPGRFLRHYSLVAYAHNREEVTTREAVLFLADASWKFVDAQ